MKHTIKTEDGATLGIIDIDPERSAQIALAKESARSFDGPWYFTAGDWLEDGEIECLGTSHEMEVQIIAEGGAA